MYLFHAKYVNNNNNYKYSVYYATLPVGLPRAEIVKINYIKLIHKEIYEYLYIK